MGIYVFNRDILRKVLDNDTTDFGKHIIPDAIGRYRVSAYIFQGYWQDVGTIRSFFDANLAVCSLKPSFNFFDRDAPVYTHARFLPASYSSWRWNQDISPSLRPRGERSSHCHIPHKASAPCHNASPVRPAGRAAKS